MKKAKKSLKKKEEEFDEEEGAEEEGEEDEEESEKSLDLSEDDLERSLERLEAEAFIDDPDTRKQELMDKASAGSLSKSESQELYEILGEELGGGDRLSDEVVKGFGDNDTLQKALDVSDYLQEQTDELVKSLSTLSDHVEASDTRQHRFNLVMAKAVAEMGKLVKSMADTLEVGMSKPARLPKSQPTTQALNKSFPGNPNGGLSKEVIMDTMEAMLQKSVESGHGGAVEGHDLATAISQFEQFNTISPALLERVKKNMRAGQ